MASSRAADTYESQNDQQLDALHSKIRTLRGVGVKLSIKYMSCISLTLDSRYRLIFMMM